MLSDRYNYKPFRVFLVVDFTLKYMAESKCKCENHYINKLLSTKSPLKIESEMLLYYQMLDQEVISFSKYHCKVNEFSFC